MQRLMTGFIIVVMFVFMGCGGSGGGMSGGGNDDQGQVPDQPSYAMHIQPIFNANCTFSGCHNDQDRANGLSLTSFQNLMMGGNSGAVVVPGDAENSIIVQRLEGRITPRMPLNRPPLSDTQIQTIRRWIDQGALNN